ncbi:S-layer homology domain-containing protein [Paenisporosarcina quisquiliarum]|uniref:S-layer homology domain-containing protein n=1 Tax=Paenisporosarcina quisquiliarum TaxID=365346 RepID=UPI00373684B1
MAHQPTKSRKFLAGTVTAALVATAIVPTASAAEFSDTAGNTHEDAINALVDLGVIQGYEDGTFQPNKTLSRSDVVKMMGKWLVSLGYEVPADYASVQRFDDVSLTGNQELLKYAALVKDQGVFNGSGGKLDPTGAITRENMALVLVRAYDAINGTDLVAHVEGQEFDKEVTDLNSAKAEARPFIDVLDFYDITSVANFDPKSTTTRGQFATFLFKTSKVEAPVDAVVELSTVNPTGVKTLQVTFNKPVDSTKAVLEVKKGSVKQNVTGITFNEAKTVATIALTSKMTKGDYTVNVTGLTDAVLSKTVAVEDEKITKILFPSDYAVIENHVASGDVAGVSPEKDGLKASLKFENQYGENVTDSITGSDVTISASKGTVASLNKGSLSLKNSSDYTVGEKVVVTVVHNSTATVSTATLTVVQSANIASIAAGTITTDDAKLKDKTIYVSTMSNNASKYYIPLTVKDQYGNDLSASDLAGITVISSNTKIVKTGAFVTKNNKPALALVTPDATATYGTAVITLVSPSGVSTSLQVEVKENGKIDVLTLEQPSKELKQGVKVAVPFTAADQYGNVLASSSDLPIASVAANKITFVDGSSISATNGTLSTKVDYVNDNKLVVELTPAGNAETVILTTVTATGKVQNLTWSVSKAPVSVGISGLDSTFYTALQVGQSSDVTGLVDFVDQYGEAVSKTAGYNYTITPVDGVADTVTYSNGVFTAASKGTEEFKVTLTDASNKVLDEYNFTMESLALSDLTGFGVEDLEKHYTGDNAGASHDQTIAIFGLKGEQEVKVNQSLIANVSITNGLTVTTSGDTVTLESVTKNTDGADKTATLTVLIEGANAPVAVTKEVVYSSAAPVAASVDIKKGTTKITTPVVALNKADITDILTTGKGTFYYDLKDQYAVTSEDVHFTVTNIVDADDLGTLSVGINNTTGAVTIADSQGGTAGDSFVITATTSTGITKTIKVIIND